MSIKKIVCAISTMIMFIISAGTVETMPLVSTLSVAGMAVFIQLGKLYEA